MGMKKNKSQKLSADPVGEKDVKSHERKRVITDPRFSKIHSDPRFQKVPKNKSKVAVDSRFSAALTNKAFAKSSAPVDKRGKLTKRAAQNSLGRYYRLEEEENMEKTTTKKKKQKERAGESEESDSESGDQLEPKSTDDEEEEELSDKDLVEGDSSEEDVDVDSDASSSTTDTDDEGRADLDIDDDDEVEVENVPTVEKETHRLAILNMDWTQVKAADLFVMLNTVLPKGGQVLSVTVYPSEFGLKRMEEEAIRGPAALFDDEEENKDKDSDADDDEIDNEKLRAYEKSRLRYYYAVAVCDSVATADYLYKSCDGVEFERSSNILDVRFIPDDMEFKHPPRDQATEAPAGYEGLDFHTRALQHSNVQISWDEDEPHRTKTLKQNFNADQLADLEMKEFLASDESEDDDDDDVAEDPSERKNKSLEKYRALLTSRDGSGEEEEEEEDEHQDMEVTFHTGLEGVSKKILEKKNKSETVWESYLRKKKERKLKNRSKNSSSEDESDYSDQASEDEPNDFFEEEPPLKKAKKKADAEKEAAAAASAAELELLLADDDEGKNTMKGYKINRKKVKGKKGKKEPVSEDKLPVVDLDDPRFAALYKNPNYALDPTDPQYKRSAAYARDLTQRGQKAEDKPMMEDVVSKNDESGPTPVHEQVNDGKSGSKDKHELSLLVKCLKRKSQKLPLPSHNGTLNRSTKRR